MAAFFSFSGQAGVAPPSPLEICKACIGQKGIVLGFGKFKLPINSFGEAESGCPGEET